MVTRASRRAIQMSIQMANPAGLARCVTTNRRLTELRFSLDIKYISEMPFPANLSRKPVVNLTLT